jgi:spore coat protein H
MPAFLTVFLACAPSAIQTVDDGAVDFDSASDSGGADSAGPSDSGDTGQPPPRGCSLVASGEVHVEEGASVRLTVACADGSLPAAPITLSGAPEAATFDGSALTWTTTLADGGRYDLAFSTTEGDAGEATLWVSDAFDASGNTPVDPFTYTEEDGLPVFHLFTATDLNNTYDTAAQLVYAGRSYAVEMQTRGASSLYYPQQSYTVKFDGDDRFDAAALGLSEFDDLILQTTFDDVAGVRNVLSHRVWASLDPGRLAPQTFLVVVYKDGAFQGLYQAIERVDDDFYAARGLAETGDVYKSVNHDANFYGTNAYGGTKSTWHDGYEKIDGTPAEGEVGAFTTLDALVSWVATTDGDSFRADLDQHVDTDEFIDWFVFVTYGMVTDSGGKNAHLFNDPLTDTAFRVTPWDYNASWGQEWETSKIDVSYTQDFTWTNNVFARMLADPELAERLWSRYRAHLETGALADGVVRAEADALLDASVWARERNWRQWGIRYRGYFGHSTTVASEADYLRDWTEGRNTVISAWIDAQSAR